jgi:hypothetical protein
MLSIYNKFTLDYNPISTWHRLTCDEKNKVILNIIIISLFLYFRKSIIKLLCDQNKGVFTKSDQIISDTYETLTSPILGKNIY